MSEYQYYEFRAIDRSLTAKEMAELRTCSTRARITPTSFVNHYDYGDFKGDADAWMEEYFDAFLHAASWGTRVLKLRLPAHLLDAATARAYCVGYSASLREQKKNIILTFAFEDENWEDVIDMEGQLSLLLPIRAELARGDLRALYLGWLLCAQFEEVADDKREPPVPPGLGQLGASLKSLVEFMQIDTDLLQAAAAASPPLVAAESDRAQIRSWLAHLPSAEKDDYLARLMSGEEGAIGNELIRRMRRVREDNRSGADAPRRTAAELLRSAEEAAAQRERIAAEKAAREAERREREAAEARAKHLDGLAGQEAKLWAKIELLAATRLPKGYTEAITLLVDLRDLAARTDAAGFRRRLEALRTAHARKPSFVARLDKVGL